MSRAAPSGGRSPRRREGSDAATARGAPAVATARGGGAAAAARARPAATAVRVGGAPRARWAAAAAGSAARRRRGAAAAAEKSSFTGPPGGRARWRHPRAAPRRGEGALLRVASWSIDTEERAASSELRLYSPTPGVPAGERVPPEFHLPAAAGVLAAHRQRRPRRRRDRRRVAEPPAHRGGRLAAHRGNLRAIAPAAVASAAADVSSPVTLTTVRGRRGPASPASRPGCSRASAQPGPCVAWWSRSSSSREHSRRVGGSGPSRSRSARIAAETTGRQGSSPSPSPLGNPRSSSSADWRPATVRASSAISSSLACIGRRPGVDSCRNSFRLKPRFTLEEELGAVNCALARLSGYHTVQY